jgi:AraC family transcriptional regulator, regulatory protein of adaptative response / methylated-DNA-[protein]-cysteine methyltransferase
MIKLPDEETMFNAILNKDPAFEGIFYFGVRTTGIFCRPSCTARKPKKENIEYFASVNEGLLRGYLPCKVCRPLALQGEYPEWLKPLMDEIEGNPQIRLKSWDLRKRNIDPNRVRRWFLKNHKMTFLVYLKTLRITEAFGRIKHGEKVIDTAFESGYESLSGFAESFKKSAGFSPVLSRSKNPVFITRILTPLGPMIAGAVEEGICLLEFADRRMLETQLERLKKIFSTELIPGSQKHFEKLSLEIKEYFAGERRVFDVPVVLNGTVFQEKIWNILIKIPYGETRSYKDQAIAAGNPAAVRAAAKANGDNRISIIIPCHRVIGSDGNLTGYGGGLWRKKYLLELERKHS